MNQFTFTFFFWRKWHRPVALHFAWLKGMWALSFRLAWVGVEINNNSVWTLSERWAK